MAANPADLPALFESAWNAHDMAAFAELFHPESTFVNRIGSYWRGRDRVVAEHAAIHATIYRDTTIANTLLDCDDIADGVAVVHLLSRATMGAAMPRGPRRLDCVMMLIATRRDGDWRIQAGENVAIVDPATGEPILSAQP